MAAEGTGSNPVVPSMKKWIPVEGWDYGAWYLCGEAFGGDSPGGLQLYSTGTVFAGSHETSYQFPRIWDPHPFGNDDFKVALMSLKALKIPDPWDGRGADEA